MKVFITGGSGLLGQYLNVFLSEKFGILAQYHKNEGNCRYFSSIKLDLTNDNELRKVRHHFKPDVIVHTACYSRPEICAGISEKEVLKLNAVASGRLAEYADNCGAKIIYTSTDLVYDGNSGGMLKEDGILNPLTLYASSKLEGENAVRSATDNYIILRTSLLIGFGLNHSRNNFHLTYEKLRAGENVNLFKDQFRTPLSLLTASRIIAHLCGSEISGQTVNFGGKEKVSRLQIGEILCDEAGFDKSLISPLSCIGAGIFPQVPDVSMNTDKLESITGIRKSLRDDIKEILDYRNNQ